MPVGEFIGEIILRPIFEIVLYGLSYWTGFLCLKALSFGSIRLAPLTTIDEKNRKKKKWHQIDWSIWLHRPMQGKALKAEYTCLDGMLVWVVVGCGIYFSMSKEQSAAKTVASASRISNSFHFLPVDTRRHSNLPATT
jgi:hypothetical protein